MKKEYSVFTSFTTFYKREVIRFLKVWGQTILGPIITTSLYLGVFAIAMEGRAEQYNGFSYSQFLLPGLIMMALIQNAFANTSSSILIAKINGNIVDTLMAPLHTNSVIMAYVLGSVTRGLLVGVITLFYSLIFMDLPIHSIFYMLYFAIVSCAILGLLGVIGGIISIKFDQLANFTNLVIVPLSFLSGTFYSISKLPSVFQHIIHYNPFFYMIDGFRYAFLGESDSNVVLGAVILGILTVVLYICNFIMWKKGYKMKQ